MTCSFDRARRGSSTGRIHLESSLFMAVLAGVLAACGGGGAAPTPPPPPPPSFTLASVSPASGPAAGGTTLTLRGTAFAAGATVQVGGVAATSVVFEGSEQLTAVAPAHAPGPADVVVTLPGGATASASAAFRFVASPVLSSLEPGHLPPAGGTVILRGSGFAEGARVLLGDAEATAVQWRSEAELSVAAPAHAPGLVEVAVVNPDGQRGGLPASLRYDEEVPPPPPPVGPPALASVSPGSGTETGGTVVVLAGEGFDAGATVRFDGALATLTAHSATRLTVATPPHPPGAVAVVVANPDGRSSTLPEAFTYVAVPSPPPLLTGVAPASGPAAGGTTVLLTGSGFAPGAQVAFGGASAAVLLEAAEALTVLAPAHGAGPVDVVVVNPDGQLATVAGGYTYLAPPVLALLAVAPASGPSAGGTVLTLTGSGFEAGASVSVGGLAAQVSAVTATSLTATTPPHAAGVVAVVVTNPGGASVTLPAAFSYLDPPPPVLSSLSPVSGPDLGDTSVILAGSGFAAGATVTFGGVDAAVTTRSATSLTVTAPPHTAGLVDVSVVNPGGPASTLAGAFTYLPPPQLASVAPATGSTAGGDTVTLTGAGFQAGAVVRFGGLAASVTSYASSSLVVTTPAHAPGLVEVLVVNPDGRQAAQQGAYTFVAPPPDAPTIATVAPATGSTLGGTAVVISGAGFDAGASASLGGAPAVVTVRSATSLSVITPAHAAGAVDVVVVNGDGQPATRGSAYTYVAPPPPAPVLTGLSPISGPDAGGTAVTLSGSNFLAGATVSFGGVAATVGSVTATSISVTTPAHLAGAVDVTVVNPGGQATTLAAAFTYVAPPPPAPVLVGLTPAEGPDTGGTLVTLSGSDFRAGATVTFGGAPAQVGLVSASAITTQAPAHAAGLVDVTVTNPDGRASTLHAAFSYVGAPPPPPVLPAPILASLTPASGPISGGDLVALSGASFQAGATVTFGGVSAPVSTVAATSITVTAPAHEAGAVDVTVLNPDGQLVTLPAVYLYLAPPSLISLSPTSGLTSGGTSVLLTGSGFQAGATVSFGGTAATVGAVAAGSITVTTPARAAGPVAVTVVNPDGQASTLASAYSYVPPPPAISSLAPVNGTTLGGTSVVVTGSGFQAGANASLGGSPATVTAVSATSLSLTSPAHAAGPVALTITNPEGQLATRGSAYTYVAPPPPAPVLTSLSPTSGPDAGGTAVTLSGSNFLAGATVSFGGVAATVGSVTATSLSATTPAHLAGAVDVTVVNPGGQATTLAAAFTFVAPPPAPILSSVLPASGTTAGGTAVALSGANFRAGAVVTFGGLTAPVVSSSSTAIAVTTPAHAAGVVDVRVVNPDGQGVTLPAAFTYATPPPPPPTLTGLSPVAGPTAGGTTVVLAGTGLSGATATVGGLAAAVTASSATSLTVTTPAHAAGAVDVVVTGAGAQTATLAGAFAYLAPPPPPALAGLSPVSGTTLGGTSVSLAGSAFAAGAVVRFGGVAATVTASSATSITATTPVHAAGAVDVAVQNPDGQVSTLVAAFTYLAPPPPPAIASITPASGPAAGGTSAVLAGTGFVSGATVTLDGVSAAVAGVSATAISLTTPAHAAGAVDVVVTNPDGRSSTLPGGFTYLAPPPAPTITGMTPSGGPLAGGTVVNLTGADFVGGATVTFGATAGAVTALTATAITVSSPPGAAGPVDVTVTNPDGQAASLVGGFTYADPPPPGAPPSITSVTPNNGYVNGGTQVSIVGRDLDVVDVHFGGVAGVVVSTSKTLLVVTTPAHAEGPVDVVVVNADGQRATRVNGYRYIPLPVLPAPVVTGVSPASGTTAGNASVVVSGSNFFAGATVAFGGSPGLVTAVTSSAITVLTPAHAPGPVEVVVANVDRQAGALAGGYAFVSPPPVITAVGNRGSAQEGGGTQLFIGSGLQNTVSISFGGAEATGLAYDPVFGNLTATIPPSPLGPTADGFVDIVLTNLDGQRTTWPSFHYGYPPTALSFTPTEAPRDAPVVITGFNFTADGAGPRAGLTVSFGGNAAVVTAKSATELTVLVPKMNPGQYKILVVNFDGQVGVAPGVFIAPGP